jgi:cell division protein FtsB
MAVLRALDLVDRLQQQNVQLAGQVGFYQARIQSLEEQVKLLTDTQHAPAQPTQPEAELASQPVEPKRVPWWRKWFADI